MVALDGETLPSLVVAIAPILGTVMYEARSHYHQVLEDVVTYQEFDSLCYILRVSLYLFRERSCSSSRKWGVTDFQQVWHWIAYTRFE